MATRGPLETAERAAELLYARGARRVWAFGSLGEGHTLDVHSDVDLAVEGVTAAAIEQTKDELCRSSPCKVDVIAMESSDPQLRWFVARGRLIPKGGSAPLRNPSRMNLMQRRLAAVADELARVRACRVLDLGCGPCWLVERLVTNEHVEAILGVDKDDRVLARARRRLADRLTAAELARVTLAHGLVTWRDPRFAGYDAAVLMEVVEHLEAPQRAAVERAVFDFARPATVIVTTPNADYNVRLGLAAGEYRHRDHRFEWGRDEFAAWGETVASRHGYGFAAVAVGYEHERHGAPTQLGRFIIPPGAPGG
jgi:SAM-dependent methyltransferase